MKTETLKKEEEERVNKLLQAFQAFVCKIVQNHLSSSTLMSHVSQDHIGKET